MALGVLIGWLWSVCKAFQIVQNFAKHCKATTPYAVHIQYMVAFMSMYVIGGKSIHRQYLGKGMNSCVKENLTTKHKTTDSAPSLKYM